MVCGATLTVALRDGAVLPPASPSVVTADLSGAYSGNTKNKRGHAEIDALYQFFKAAGWSDAVIGSYDLEIDCPAKPCCVRCSAILGLLGVSAAPNQRKTTGTMGKTAYGAHPDFTEYLARRLYEKETKIRVEIYGWAC